MKRTCFFTAALTALLLPACVLIDFTRLKNEPVDFVSEVKPILEARCLECHHSRYVFAGLNLETKTLAMKGGRSGPVIVAGAPHKSLIYKVLLLGHDNPIAMPPSPDPLSREEEQAIHDWILQGAKWPDGVRLVPPQDWKKSRS
ncbi:c-type cytochrome domain-containing protein [Prosthecobacter sp.]|uniref:c-type cytochrome domain-containing protein n=1 Tax=Prosthecobacter sp. TaxID=1965333 RepID=UPI001D3A380F|nr:c-type cytochrome domain-containing protein [Prosthecobacter sp.]MCB1277683.1 hypothetical protein [Prosthecobacter sp.]